MKYHLFIVLCLIGCQTLPLDDLNRLTPQECWAYGVMVFPSAEITQQVKEKKWGDFAHLERWCTGGVDHQRLWHGCARDGVIYYAEHKCVPQHEACHWIYNAPFDTIDFSRRAMQGDWLAACLTSNNQIDPPTRPVSPHWNRHRSHSSRSPTTH